MRPAAAGAASNATAAPTAHSRTASKSCGIRPARGADEPTSRAAEKPANDQRRRPNRREQPQVRRLGARRRDLVTAVAEDRGREVQTDSVLHRGPAVQPQLLASLGRRWRRWRWRRHRSRTRSRNARKKSSSRPGTSSRSAAKRRRAISTSSNCTTTRRCWPICSARSPSRRARSASRTRARGLTGADPRIQKFIRGARASGYGRWTRRRRQLADVELDNAVPPEQAALQHLLRAESVFTDIQVAFQQQGGGGGGGAAGRDLSELFELEMDLEKNQYETEVARRVRRPEQSSPQEQADEAIRKLHEPARRQEQLAESGASAATATCPSKSAGSRSRCAARPRSSRSSSRKCSSSSRKRNSSSKGSKGSRGKQGQQGQQGQPGQPGQQGQQGQQQANGGQQGSETQRAIDQLNPSAASRMNQASGQGQASSRQQMTPGGGAARDRAGAASAQRSAAAADGGAASGQVGQAFEDLAQRFAGRLRTSQRAGRERFAGSAAHRPRGRPGQPAARLRYPTIRRKQLAERRRATCRRAREARGRHSAASRSSSAQQTPEASEALNQALADLQSVQTSVRLGYAR